MTGLVPGLGTTRRLRALVALGHRPADLRAASGLVVEALLWANYMMVAPEIAARAGLLFDRLSGTQGADESCKELGQMLRWATPHAWYDVDIDAPGARPDRGTRLDRGGVDEQAVYRMVTGDKPAKVWPVDIAEAVRILVGRGLSNADTAAVAGITKRSVQRVRPRPHAHMPRTVTAS